MTSYHERLKLIKLGQLPKEAVAKPKKPLAKQSEKKKKEIADERNSPEGKLDWFYNEMRELLVGKCEFCGEMTTWKNKELWRIAIAHLLPKSKFKSVATNINNWVELCWDCHTTFDSGKITWLMLKDSKEWDILSEKLLNVLPLVNENERKHKLYSKLEKLVYIHDGEN